MYKYTINITKICKFQNDTFEQTLMHGNVEDKFEFFEIMRNCATMLNKDSKYIIGYILHKGEPKKYYMSKNRIIKEVKL